MLLLLRPLLLCMPAVVPVGSRLVLLGLLLWPVLILLSRLSAVLLLNLLLLFAVLFAYLGLLFAGVTVLFALIAVLFALATVLCKAKSGDSKKYEQKKYVA